MTRHIKLFEARVDPFNEEDWDEEERILYPIEWHFNQEGGVNYAMVGELLIGSYFKPSIEKLLGNRFHIRIGLGQGNLKYIEEKFKTPVECQEYITNWWYEFAEKISFHK